MYQLKVHQKIPASVGEAWEFISSPHNLKRITPDYMGFEITNEPIPYKMYEGMIITYNVTPLLGIKMQWVTEITHVKELKYFVDEQRVGPYTMWHHEHHLIELDGGIEMMDIVSYKPPMGFIGKMANAIFINKQLQGIFDYRFQAIERIFGKFDK